MNQRRKSYPGGGVARKIWSQSGNPPKWVSDSLGIERWQLREAIHKIKASNGMGPADEIGIWDDGCVTDWRGDFCGDIRDEI
jgi:hypothetical protein